MQISFGDGSGLHSLVFIDLMFTPEEEDSIKRNLIEPFIKEVIPRGLRLHVPTEKCAEIFGQFLRPPTMRAQWGDTYSWNVGEPFLLDHRGEKTPREEVPLLMG